MTQRRRVEYVPQGQLGAALDALAVYQRHREHGQLTAAASAARAAELAIARLVDESLDEASARPSSARQVAGETGIPPATVTYRIRRHHTRTEEDE